MSAAAISHLYRYRAPSVLEAGSAPALRLATSGGAVEWPLFFRGELVEPRTSALFLRGLSRVVGSRFHVPPAMVARILREADPVVTSGGGMLRFEGFSACASAYARVDLTPAAYAGEIVAEGTTNVDFNAAMRAALASVTDAGALRLSVGADRLELERAGETVVERKVPLPIRWLKGFVEVQAYQARMSPRFTLAGHEILRFLRALPRASTGRHQQWIVPSGRSVRVSMTEARGALAVSGTERLRVLEDLAPVARALRIHGDEAGQATAWELDAGALRFTLVLSASVWRGFSGEGQALEILASSERSALVAKTRAMLRWQSVLQPADLAGPLAASERDARDALIVLGSRGLVGFDLASAAFFHRELPFDLGAVEALQPRLVAARGLVAAGGIEIGEPREGSVEVFVPGSDVKHRVVVGEDDARCSCPWFAQHEGARGPCKHVLAAQIALEEQRS